MGNGITVTRMLKLNLMAPLITSFSCLCVAFNSFTLTRKKLKVLVEEIIKVSSPVAVVHSVERG